MAETKPRRGTKADLQNKLNTAIKMNAYLSREAMARGLGQSFGGDRDLYSVLGYPLEPEYQDYLNIYERDGIGTRVVDAAPDETWRKHPILYVGDEAPSEDDPGDLQESFNDFCNEYDIWSAFNDMDKACGISRFSLMFLGLPGELDQKVSGGKTKLAFVSVHDEGEATVEETSIIRDPTDPVFGLPEYYLVKIDDGAGTEKRVHSSRVIHLKYGKDRSRGMGRVYGVPSLKKVLNRMFDLEKVVGGGSEAFWLLIHRGLALLAKEGMTLPDPGTPEYKNLQDEIDDFKNKISRVIRLVGMDIKDLGAEPVDSREQFDVIIDYIAGSEKIPKRILLGSERGELASGQDETDWQKFIDWRRHNVAEPYILRRFLKIADQYGFFNVPDNYKVFWPPLFQLSPSQEAVEVGQIANAISTISGGAPELVYPPEEFISRLPSKWRFVPTPEQAKEMEESKAAPDKANQEPENPDVQKLLEKLPPSKEMLASLNQLLSRQNDVVGDLRYWGGKQVMSQPYIWHNVNGYSTMVALIIPDVLREELKSKYPWIQDDVLRDLHITLCYLGDIRTLNRERIDKAVVEFASMAQPLKLKMQGIARFVSEQDKDPIIALFDSPGNEIIELRRNLTNLLNQHGIPYHDDHVYIPHMTLAYIDPGDAMPEETIETMEINFDSCYLVVGDEEIEYPFGVYEEQTTL